MRDREYWLQAEPYEALAVPSGWDAFRGLPVKGETRYVGLRYRLYQPGWTAPVEGDSLIGSAGIPGPVLRAAPGDTLIVHLRNADDHYRQPHSIHAHGLDCEAGSDGVWTAHLPPQPGAAVLPGDSFTYRWKAAQTSVGTWIYHDNSRPFLTSESAAESEPNEWIGKSLGLVGFIVIAPDDRPPPDREYFLVVHDLSRADLPEFTARACGAINGKAYLGNTPELYAKVGDRVRWHIVGNNSVSAPRVSFFLHDFHVTGRRWPCQGRSQASAPIFPDTVTTLEWIEENPGRWLYRSHSIRDTSMYGWYRVDP